jgi:hypothetical protein
MHRNNTQQVQDIKCVELFDVDDEGSMFLWNTNIHTQGYIQSQPRIPQSGTLASNKLKS